MQSNDMRQAWVTKDGPSGDVCRVQNGSHLGY